MSNDEPLGFYIIEPHFYEDLSWDMDKIIRFLEFIRLNVNDKLFKHSHSKFYIVKYGDFCGNAFPAIGVTNKDPIESKELEGFDDIFEKVKAWVNSIGLDTIDSMSKELQVISWSTLMKIRHYPKE